MTAIAKALGGKFVAGTIWTNGIAQGAMSDRSADNLYLSNYYNAKKYGKKFHLDIVIDGVRFIIDFE